MESNDQPGRRDKKNIYVVCGNILIPLSLGTLVRYEPSAISNELVSRIEYHESTN